MDIQKPAYCVLLSFFALLLKAQVNLVPNPSFETYTACPYSFSQVEYSGNWFKPTLGTADYYDTCSVSMGIPNNFTGYQTAYNNGGAYMGVIAYEEINGLPQQYREYIQAQLSSALVSGQKYYLSFYVSLADSSRFSADGIGAYVSNSAISLAATGTTMAGYQAGWTNFTVTPQVSNSQGQLLNDPINWKQISGSFIASGGEQYITIGNFKNDINTFKTKRLPGNLGGGQEAYYYIDNVCLSQSAQTCGVNPNVGIEQLGAENSSFYYNSYFDKIIFKDKVGEFTIKIIDMLGNQVKLIRVDQSYEIDVSEIISGCYFIIMNDAKNTEIKKIFIE